MMKKLSLSLLLVCLVAGSLQATTVGNWTPGATGNWSTATNWSTSAVVPSTTVASSDEIKITGTSSLNGPDITVNSSGLVYACTISVVGANLNGTNTIGRPGVLRVMDGAVFGAGVLRFGNRTTSGNGAGGTGIQTGGTVSVNDFLLGQWGGSGSSVAEGYYTISGGTLQANGSNGRLWVGGNSSTVAGATSANTIGKFTVVGNAATITGKTLYVGSGTTANGSTGTLEYQIGSTGVSKIVVSNAINLDLGGASSITSLLVSGTVLPAGDIVLVENTGTGAVTGLFDNVNGGSAAQGASVVIGSNTYTLSYVYDATTGLDGSGNDIALVAPEPATLVILGLGGMLLRRRLA